MLISITAVPVSGSRRPGEQSDFLEITNCLYRTIALLSQFTDSHCLDPVVTTGFILALSRHISRNTRTMQNRTLSLVARLSDKTGSAGTVIAAMGCASCFPAIAAMGASIGLGFLSQFEGLFINTLLPIFAIVALCANLLSAWSHRRVGRMLFGIAGPCMVLATLYLFWADSWSTYMFYAGLAAMLTASIWDIASPPNNACAV